MIEEIRLSYTIDECIRNRELEDATEFIFGDVYANIKHSILRMPKGARVTLFRNGKVENL